MGNYTFRTIIEREEGDGYHGFVPLLKGVHTSGDTIEEVQQNLKEAIKCHIEGLLIDKQAVPQESGAFESIQTFSVKDSIVSPV